MRRDHPRAGDTSITLADLRDEVLLLHPREANPGHYDAILELCAAAGFQPRLALRTLSLDLAQTPVAAGEAIAIVGESTLAGLPPDLAWVPLSPRTALEIALLVRDHDRPPVVERVLALAPELARGVGQRTMPPSSPPSRTPRSISPSDATRAVIVTSGRRVRSAPSSSGAVS
jgi:DNA-binding transcriptional LysR family regulator